MNPDELINILAKGMRGTFDLVHRLNDAPDQEIQPEYLKTVKIAETLSQVLSGVMIRLEQSTAEVVSRSVLPPRTADALSISRPGKVDIVVYTEKQGFRRPVVIIENKRYVDGFYKIEDDVLRCLELLACENRKKEGSIAAASVTFLWRDQRGVTRQQQESAARRSLDKIEARLSKWVQEYGFTHRYERILLRASPFSTAQEAEAVGEEGEPAYIRDAPVTIYAVVWVTFRADRAAFLDAMVLSEPQKGALSA